MIQESDLFAAYARTSFVADSPAGRLIIRVGSKCEELDAVLAARGVSTWAYITAFNPGSVPLSDPENQLRQRALASDLQERGFTVFPGEGIGDDGQWPPEPSLLVLGISNTEARQVGSRYGQTAIVIGELGEPAELLRCG